MLQSCGDLERYPREEVLRSLYVDFNSYFASVEQQVERRLRGRPIGVVPMLADTTCCIAASYEAKRFGIKTGTPVWQARALCPDIIFVEARPHLYVDYHHRLIAAVDSCLPVESVNSIDEMACLLMGKDRDKATAIALAQVVKQAVQRVGSTLRCSIGIAPNSWLAKTASDMQKPDGLVVLEACDLPHALFGLQLRDLCGIGRNMEQRLLAAGITTVEALCLARLEQLRTIWNGLPGERLHAQLRGRVVAKPVGQGKQSISHSHVFPPEQRHPLGALGILHRLLQKAAVRLRHHGLMASHLSIKLKFLTRDGAKSWRFERAFEPSDCTLDFTKILNTAWGDRPAWTQRATPFAAAIWFSGLNDRKLFSHDLFASNTSNSHTSLDVTVDWINSHYGKNSLYFGGAHFSRDTAPARIAFTHIPDDEYQCEPDIDI